MFQVVNNFCRKQKEHETDLYLDEFIISLLM